MYLIGAKFLWGLGNAAMRGCPGKEVQFGCCFDACPDVGDGSMTSSGTERRALTKRPCLLFALGLAPKKIGGVEKFLRYFVDEMDRAGWDTVLCFDGPIAPMFREYIDGPSVTIEALENQGHLGLGCAGALFRLLRRHRPKVFVYAFHGAMRVFPWLAKLAGCRRVFFNDHSSRPTAQSLEPLALHKRLVGRLLTAPLTAICSVSEFTARTGDALGVTTAPNVVVPNGVEIPVSDPERRSRFRKTYGLNQDDLVITQVCWMVEAKGVDVMLRAAAKLLAVHRGIRIVLVGDGPKLAEYEALAERLGIAEWVLFTGMLHNPTGMGLFEASDIYCQPSVWQEACGMAVLEAMSVKLPVVASETGGLKEVVGAGESGLLVPVRDSEAIFKAFEVMLDPERRRQMGEMGYERVLRSHRIEDTARRYVDLFLGRTTTAG